MGASKSVRGTEGAERGQAEASKPENVARSSAATKPNGTPALANRSFSSPHPHSSLLPLVGEGGPRSGG